MLQQNVIAHGIHEGAEAIRLADFSAAQGSEDASKGFLSNVLNRLRGMQTGSQFELDQLAEVRHEMFLRAEVSRTEALYIGFVKGLQFQEPAPQVL